MQPSFGFNRKIHQPTEYYISNVKHRQNVKVVQIYLLHNSDRLSPK